MPAPPPADFVAAALAATADSVPVAPLPDLLDQTVRRSPGRAAIDFLGRRLSYRQLADKVARAARGLQASGVRPGDRIGLCLPNTPDFLVFYFAILKIGAVVVNYNPLYTERELEFQIRDSGTSLMVTVDLKACLEKLTRIVERGGLERVVVCAFASALPLAKAAAFRVAKRAELASWPRGDARYLDARRLLADRTPPALPAVGPQDVAVIQYTGGTTGQPKGAVLTHANLSANCAQSIAAIRRPPDRERIMGVLPLFHVFALTSVLNYGVAVGAELVLLPRFELAALLKTVRKRRVTNLPAVPTIYNAVNHAPAELRAGLDCIEYCISGGAPLPAEVKARFEALTGCTLVEGYGLSEASPVVAVNPLDGPGKAGSVGRLMLGTAVEIRDVDDLTKPVAPCERGEVCVRGPQVMRGYWNRPEETAEVLVDGLLRTGDIGYMDADGYLFLVDRKKDLILCGGYNVYPRVIEEALYTHPAVKEVTVIGVPDPYRGEAPKAFVVLEAGQSATPEALKAYLGDHLNKIEMPREIEIRSELPKTLIGKLSKKELVAEEASKRRDAA
jgi:long-chain acyl-CoA synthetase